MAGAFLAAALAGAFLATAFLAGAALVVICLAGAAFAVDAFAGAALGELVALDEAMRPGGVGAADLRRGRGVRARECG